MIYGGIHKGTILFETNHLALFKYKQHNKYTDQYKPFEK